MTKYQSTPAVPRAGRRWFGPRFSGLFAMFAALHGSLLPAQDLVQVRDGRISGRLVSMAHDGGVVVQPDLLPDPLMFGAELLVRIDFKPSEGKNGAQPAHLTLANGDSLPCAVRQWQDDGMVVDSPGLGRLHIPRAHLATIQTGYRTETPLVPPDVALAGWKRFVFDGVELGIEFGRDKERQRLILKGAAVSRLHTDLKGAFTVRFTYECPTNPNMNIAFPLIRDAAGNFNPWPYHLELKSGEVVIRGWKDQVESLVVPDLKQGCRVAVELQIDPSNGLARLSMNGRLLAEMTELKGLREPFGGIEFRSSSGELETQFIDGFRIDSWDAEADILRRLEPQRTDRDTLVGRAGGALAGHLVSIRADARQFGVEFAADDARRSPRYLPAFEVLAIHFAKQEDPHHAAVPAATPRFAGSLRSGARLSFTHCVIAGDFASIDHPLLGKLKVARADLASLSRAHESPSSSDP